MTYQPSQEILERYARVLVDFGLNEGEGLNPGETVGVFATDAATPLYAEVCNAIWRSGGNVIHGFRPDESHGIDRSFYELAGDAQLDFFAAKYRRGLIDQLDHIIQIFGTNNPHALAGIDPAKMMRRQAAQQEAIKWQFEKDRAGEFDFTIGLYGTAPMAAEAGLTLEQYWEQIIKACFLDDPDPIKRWHETYAEMHRYRDWLTSLKIERLHVEAEGTDLWLTLGEHRRWVCGSGRNVPTFEIFTSPDWRGTNGRISFSEPLYVHGSLVKGVALEFKDGLVVSATAQENGELLKQIVAAPGGNKVGEYSLTDARISRIDRFMANTLFDENVGGPFGNTHLAVGLALDDCYDGDRAGVDRELLTGDLGFNLDAAVHQDIVSTTDRTVTAYLPDGSERVIYAGGQFQAD